MPAAGAFACLRCLYQLRHALAGVDKGRKAGTNPVEIMGLCIGKPEGNAVISTYALALALLPCVIAEEICDISST